MHCNFILHQYFAFLHQNGCFLNTVIFAFFTSKVCFFTPIYFFTPKSLLFYTRIFAFFTPNFCSFYTNIVTRNFEIFEQKFKKQLLQKNKKNGVKNVENGGKSGGKGYYLIFMIKYLENMNIFYKEAWFLTGFQNLV